MEADGCSGYCDESIHERKYRVCRCIQLSALQGQGCRRPTQLQELDTTEIALPFGAQDEDGKPQEDAVQKYRDVLKSAVIKEDGEAAYILLGIENQTDIHYAMPVRNAVYDALQYGRQVPILAKKHRREDASSKAHSRGRIPLGVL